MQTFRLSISVIQKNYMLRIQQFKNLITFLFFCFFASHLGLTGKFNSWSSEQVQLWLYQALTESNAFSQATIHKTLQKINGEKGFDLTTFTRTQWREKLSDCDEPTAPIRMWEHVWGLVSKCFLWKHFLFLFIPFQRNKFEHDCLIF